MTQKHTEKLNQKLQNLPENPGCYQMMAADGTVIYVGKAIVLRNRVRSYFHSSARKDSKTRALVAEIDDISWWVTETELEALILENELIKRYRPRFNVRLKDDRQFPYIKVHWKDDFPKISVVRRIRKDGARYFGPYSSSRACYQTLDALRRVFPYLDCDREITGQDERPCLYYHIKLCGGPCIGRQSQDEYRTTISQLMSFLHGETDEVVTQMQDQMQRASKNLQFELAALYRDRIQAAQRIVEQQKIISATMEDADYIALAQDSRTAEAAVQVFIVRNGRLIGRENFILEGATVIEQTAENEEIEQAENNTGADGESVSEAEEQGNLIGTFIQQFYDNAVFVPKLILVHAMPGKVNSSGSEISFGTSVDVLEAWLSDKRGSKVELRVPQRGAKREFMELAKRNAAEYLRLQQAEWAADTNRQTQSISDLQEALTLERPPARIECYDISTLQGTNTVGSMVVFGKGAPLKSAYKRFKIRGKGAQGEPDDFASMREMLRRRFRRAVEENDQADPGKKTRSSDENWRILPDLVIIDGGKGQLGIATEVLEEFGLFGRIPVVGLAKREEEIFHPGKSKPTWLKRGSPALHLVQRIRDEAHRFAITYHRRLRSKEQTRSKLDDVPGIGPTRRKALLKHFGGDIEKIRQSSIDELTAVSGITRKAAEAIKEYL
ncbi:excinuclease ABC subunit UvrC [Chloroflexi bacterium TSY]|nr:excinuclease ABC subunit UvrC [Chloroflexi bacterium TSY]